MRTSAVLTVILMGFLLPSVGIGVSTQSSRGQTCLLPWEVIAKKFREGRSFCGNEGFLKGDTPQDRTVGAVRTDPKCGYACQPKEAITVRLPPGIVTIDPSEQIGVNLAKYAENSWQEIGKVSASTEPNKMRIAGGIGEEGFFRLSCDLKARNGGAYNCRAYVIVCSNWKKDILAFCRGLKEEIETNPDSQLIRSSISVSHFDHVMEIISEASVLPDEVLKALSGSVKSKHDFDAGKCPDLVIGLNKIRLKRFAGSPIEEFVVLVPDDYTRSKSWPVFVHPDIRRLGAHNDYPAGSGFIEVWWHTVLYKDLRWKDFRKIMEMVTDQLNVDEDKVYIEGDCRNGVDAAAMALNSPDRWAECSIVLGNSYRYLAGNALNLPLNLVKGSHNNEGSSIGFYNYTVKCFQYHGCRHFRCSETKSITETRGTPIPNAVREKSPRRISFTIESLGNPKAYWVRIVGREDENLIGRIDASVVDQTILVKTNNVDAYSLDITQAPVDLNKPVEIVENGHNLGPVTDHIFTKRNEKYIDAVYTKNDHLHGPIQDVFTNQYVIVYGTGGLNARFAQTNKSIAEKLASGAPCLADTDLSKKMIFSHNLILVGSVESNCWLAQISERLPLRITSKQVCTTEGKNFDGNDLGFIVIYPNPLNPDKYVVVFSATSEMAMANIFNAYSQMKSAISADVGIYEITQQGSIKWHISERLNTVWNWHGKYDKVLLSVDRDHPKWQWKQWVAHVVKKQMSVDIVICEDHLRNFDVLSPGEKTYRDLFNAFQNAWFSKVKIDGRSLRAVLMVPLNRISKREVNAPIIEGISLLKNPMVNGKDGLTINELRNETIYTVAFPEKCLNGQRMGLVIQNYDIIDQKYFMPILEEFLKSNSELNIDDQLDSLKFNMY